MNVAPDSEACSTSIVEGPRNSRADIRTPRAQHVLQLRSGLHLLQRRDDLLFRESTLPHAVLHGRGGLALRLDQFAGVRSGRLTIHNNGSERELRREAAGRKNWLFVGSDDGAVNNVTFVSLIASCQLHGIEPWAYLRDLFCLIPSWPVSRALELAPANWKKTLEHEDVQQRLAANVFRSAVLGLDQHLPTK